MWIGHDSREADATHVCAKSLHRHASIPLHVQLVHEPSLRHAGLYRRDWTVEEGRRIDTRDGKPFSTSFSFARFLVPALMQWRGVALFCDCDFLFLDDVAELMAQFDPGFAVQVVKHAPLAETGTKMDGQAQQPYFRKNWSSLVLWNCGHPSNQRITPFLVNSQSGQYLHAFSWLDDDEIGELDPDWNWLAGVQALPDHGAGPTTPKAVHFTLGVPSMKGHENAPLADLWRAELEA